MENDKRIDGNISKKALMLEFKNKCIGDCARCPEKREYGNILLEEYIRWCGLIEDAPVIDNN